MFSLTYTSFVLTTVLILCKLTLPTHSLPFDLSQLLDPVHQAEEEGDLEAKRVFAKSVFNVPVKTESPIPPCPEGSQRVTANGDCVSKAPSISYGDKFLFDSIRNFYKAKPSPSPSTPHRRRRPSTPRSTTTPRYEEVPTYIFEEESKPSLVTVQPPNKPDVVAEPEKPGVKYESSTANPVTESAAIPSSPVTQEPQSVSPVTEKSNPVQPVTETLGTVHPVTEKTTSVQPVTEKSNSVHPVTETSTSNHFTSTDETERNSPVTTQTILSPPVTEAFNQTQEDVTQIANGTNPDASDPVVNLVSSVPTTIHTTPFNDLDLDQNQEKESFAAQPESDPVEPTTFPASAVEIDVTVVPAADHSSDIIFPDPNLTIDLRQPTPVISTSNPIPSATVLTPEPTTVLPTKDEIGTKSSESPSDDSFQTQNQTLLPSTSEPEATIARVEEIIRKIQSPEEESMTTVHAPRTEVFNIDYSTVQDSLHPTTSHSSYG